MLNSIEDIPANIIEVTFSHYLYNLLLLFKLMAKKYDGIH